MIEETLNKENILQLPEQITSIIDEPIPNKEDTIKIEDLEVPDKMKNGENGEMESEEKKDEGNDEVNEDDMKKSPVE